MCVCGGGGVGKAPATGACVGASHLRPDALASHHAANPHCGEDDDDDFKVFPASAPLCQSLSHGLSALPRFFLSNVFVRFLVILERVTNSYE